MTHSRILLNEAGPAHGPAVTGVVLQGDGFDSGTGAFRYTGDFRGLGVNAPKRRRKWATGAILEFYAPIKRYIDLPLSAKLERRQSYIIESKITRFVEHKMVSKVFRMINMDIKSRVIVESSLKTIGRLPNRVYKDLSDKYKRNEKIKKVKGLFDAYKEVKDD